MQSNNLLDSSDFLAKSFDKTQPRMMGDSDISAIARVDDYQILKKLSGDGYGSVYLAQDLKTDVFYVIKCIHPLLKHSTEEMERLRTQFALVSRLNHPNIASAHALHEVGYVSSPGEDARRALVLQSGDLVMVTCYAPGVTLSRWQSQFKDGIVPIRKAVDICYQVAEALDYAHSKHVIHRDIKPSNIVVDQRADGSLNVQILDFGLTSAINAAMNRVSSESVATSADYSYMTPEQWSGVWQGAAADQYSLAVILYEMLSGVVPFADAFKTGDFHVMKSAITSNEPEAIPSLTLAQNKVLLRALSKSPDNRYLSCSAFINAFDEPTPHSGSVAKISLFAGALLLSVLVSIVCVRSCAKTVKIAPIQSKSIEKQMENDEDKKSVEIALEERLAAARMEAEHKLEEVERLNKETDDKIAALQKESVLRENIAKEKIEAVQKSAAYAEEKLVATRMEVERKLEEVERLNKEIDDKIAALQKESALREDIAKEKIEAAQKSAARAEEESKQTKNETDEIIKKVQGESSQKIEFANKTDAESKKATTAPITIGTNNPTITKTSQSQRPANASSNVVVSSAQPPSIKYKLGISLDGKDIMLEIVKIQAGVFDMGSPESETGRWEDEVLHRVALTTDYWIGKYEVTQEQYECLMNINPSGFKGAKRPVEQVTWSEAKEFCEKLNYLLKDRLPKGYGFSLPTEAQWEYACCAGVSASLHPINDPINQNGGGLNLDEIAWYWENSARITHPVGKKKANDWGLHDMFGNVWEWCDDWYGDYSGDAVDPTGPAAGISRVFRGGSWFGDARTCRSAFRGGHSPDVRYSHLGFRVALRHL